MKVGRLLKPAAGKLTGLDDSQTGCGGGGANAPGEPPRWGGCYVTGVVAASCPHAMPPKSTVAKKDPAKKTQQASGQIQDAKGTPSSQRAPATAKGKATKTSAKLKGAAAAILAGTGMSGVRSPRGECRAQARGW